MRTLRLCSVLTVAFALTVGCATGSGGELPPGPGPDGGVRDAGATPDSGTVTPTDAGGGGTTGCTSNAECSDGIGCNGEERCEGGRCVPGTPPACDDGVACTTNRCVEPGTCVYEPNDALCPAGQTCTATGCAGAACSETPCRLVGPQCGCPAGQGCYHSGSSRGCAMAGTGGMGASCSAQTDCAAGLTCVNHSAVSGTVLGMCTRYCQTDAECTGAGSICVDLDPAAAPGVRVCTQACDPIYGSGCRPGTTCTIYYIESGSTTRYLTDCLGPVGTRGTYASCSSDVDCAANHVCLDGYCYRWCNYATDAPCDYDELCYGFNPPVTIGATTYGVCDL